MNARLYTMLYPLGLDAGIAADCGDQRLRAHHETLEGELGS